MRSCSSSHNVLFLVSCFILHCSKYLPVSAVHRLPEIKNLRSCHDIRSETCYNVVSTSLSRMWKFPRRSQNKMSWTLYTHLILISMRRNLYPSLFITYTRAYLLRYCMFYPSSAFRKICLRVLDDGGVSNLLCRLLGARAQISGRIPVNSHDF